MIASLIYLIIQLVILGFIYWVITQLPFIVDPWRRILLALVVLIGALILVLFLLGMAGIPIHSYRSL